MNGVEMPIGRCSNVGSAANPRTGLGSAVRRFIGERYFVKQFSDRGSAAKEQLNVGSSVKRYSYRGSALVSAALILLCSTAIVSPTARGAGAAGDRARSGEGEAREAAAAAAGGANEVSGWFPDLEGWTREAEPSLYDSETLYEYIDGAADLYINYDFRELAALSYERGEEQGITVEIYRHGAARDAFGIYAQERPAGGGFIEIGTQGYYDTGILNFLKGNFYVKISGYYLGEEDERTLKAAANAVASRLGGESGLPAAIAAFPDSGKILNSERYIAVSFMGHGFLHSAFVADYKSGGGEFSLFIIEADDMADADAMVGSYLKLAKGKGEAVLSQGAIHRFKDPYRKSKGAVNLKSRGRYIWGLMSDDVPLCDFYLKEVEARLDKIGLLNGAGP